jgi:hypothetical protein
LEIKGTSPRLFAEFCKANPGTAVAIDKQQQRALEDLGGLYAGALAGGVAAGRGRKTGKWTTAEITILHDMKQAGDTWEDVRAPRAPPPPRSMHRFECSTL